mmetsp:Transcript_22214/g.40884  ORF Transcript_22214/g.40884 Transcript_22214/m.40884 type:complete len:222 (+) Transcript_22214:513-1178(+)
MLCPQSSVRNFFSSRTRVMGPGGNSTTSTRTLAGHNSAATFCMQYNLRLSSVNQRSAESYSSAPVEGSTRGRPVSLSLSLQRHCNTSMGGNGSTSFHTTSSGCSRRKPLSSPQLSTYATCCMLAMASSSDRPSRKSCRARICEKRTAKGEISLIPPDATPSVPAGTSASTDPHSSSSASTSTASKATGLAGASQAARGGTAAMVMGHPVPNGTPYPTYCRA